MATGGGMNRTRVSAVRVAKLTRRERAELRKRPPPPKATKPAKLPRGWRHGMPKREKAKRRRRVKRFFGLTRRECGAIGAGHLEAPEGYRDAVAIEGLSRRRR